MSNKKRNRTRKRKNISSPPENQPTPKKLNFDNMDQIHFLVESNKKLLENTNNISNDLKLMNEKYDKQLKNVDKKINNLNNRLCGIEKNDSKKSVIIVGVPRVDNESSKDLIKFISKIGSKLKISNLDKEIDDIFRYGKTRNNIKVTFTTTLRKKEVLCSNKLVKLNVSDLGFESSDEIFMFEYLCYDNHKLLLEAKKLRKEGSIKYVWSHNGTILVRQSEGGNVIVIRSFEDLAQLM